MTGAFADALCRRDERRRDRECDGLVAIKSEDKSVASAKRDATCTKEVFVTIADGGPSLKFGASDAAVR